MKSSNIVTIAGKFLNDKLITELRDQGHYLTGALENSISTSMLVENQNKRSIVYGFALDYAIKLNNPQHEIRNLPTVQELTNYFILRRYPPGEAARIAYLTHKKHLEEGMPTKKSSRFSKTGIRIQFIDRVWKSNEQILDQKMEAGMDDIFNTEVSKQKSEVI